MTKFCERLQLLINENNLTIKQLAKDLKIGERQVSKYVKGTITPRLRIALKIREYFGVSMDFLIGISDEKYIKTR